MNARRIVGSIFAAVFTIIILNEVFALAAPGPFSLVLNQIQAVSGIVIGAIVIGAPAVAYWIIKRVS